jgi:hypothetical protein
MNLCEAVYNIAAVDVRAKLFTPDMSLEVELYA